MLRRLLLLGLLLVEAMGFPGVDALAEQKPTEFEIKAAYLYNFAKFVEWPAGGRRAEDPLMNVCLAGADPFGPTLSVIEGKLVHDRKMRVLRYAGQQLSNCDILFISGSEAKELPQVLKAVAGAPVLTVGDTPGYAQQGVMINFFIEDQTVRFEINLGAAQAAGLQISAGLLKIARIVRAP